MFWIANLLTNEERKDRSLGEVVHKRFMDCPPSGNMKVSNLITMLS